VVVMIDGQVVQAGTPVELFERPRHTFVGHFIGSPGMNLMACEIDAAGIARVGGQAVPTAIADAGAARGKRCEVGVRPEFIRFAAEGLPVRIERVADVGRFRIVDARHGEQLIKVLVGEGDALPRENGHLRFDPLRTQVYADGWIVE
jgi:glycerol transport system ATP-binding protein